MKKWIKIAGLLLLTLPVAAPADDFTYTTNSDNTININSYTGTSWAVIIPNTIDGRLVTTIGSSTFRTSPTIILIGNNLTNIARGAFFNCTNLTEIIVDKNNVFFSSADGVLFDRNQTTVLLYPKGKAGDFRVPSTVTNIGPNAFDSCHSLTSIVIPSSVTSIGEGAFWWCDGLTSIMIPNGITNIEYGTFNGCTALTNVILGGSVVSIQSRAFDYCTNLTIVTIPACVTNIKSTAFIECLSLISIAVDQANAFYSSMDGVLANKDKTKLITYPAGKIRNCYRIPDSITSLEPMAFMGCNITSIRIGNNVTNIGSYAFNECTSLANVYFNGNAPKLDSPEYTFPDNTTVYYLPGTTGWNSTFGKRLTVLWNPKIQTGDTDFGVRSNRFGFNISATNNLTVMVETCTNLAEGVWVPVETNTLTGGSAQFSDPDSTNYPSRYYRVSMPQ